MPIDTESLTSMMHEYGINMRYLSFIACMTTVPHIRQLCITEMLGRTCKNILNEQMAEAIIEENQKLTRANFGLKKKKLNVFADDFENDKNSDGKIEPHGMDGAKDCSSCQEGDSVNECVIDILNLIFGRGEETDLFWSNYLVVQCVSKFEFEEAIAYTGYDGTVERLINRSEVNLVALFWVINSLIGLKINVF